MMMHWHEVEIRSVDDGHTVDRLCWRGGELVKPWQPHVWYEDAKQLDADQEAVINAAKREVMGYGMMHEALVFACGWNEETDDEACVELARLRNW